MKNLLTISLSIFLLSATSVYAQTSNFFGTWELMRPPLTEENKNLIYPILRSYDEKGNYTQFAVTKNGTFIEGKASFEPLTADTVKEVINFAANASRIGKTFTFHYKIVNNNSSQFLITEGKKKIVDGKETVEWREVWRKVEEFKGN